MVKHKNLLIICPDEMRGDCAGYMGNPVVRTPHIDALAQRGVVFTKHFTVMPKCVPARINLMTGRYAHSDGLRSVSQHLPSGRPDLLQTMRGAGYQTAMFGKDHCWGHDLLASHMDFTSYDEQMKHHLDGVLPLSDGRPAPGSPTEFALDGWDYVGCRTRHQADERYVDQAVEFLSRHRDPDRPFFLQLNIESPHPVYGVEEPWYSMYRAEDLNRWPSGLPTDPPLPVRTQREVRTQPAAPDDAAIEAASAEIQRVYYGMISKVDHLVGRVAEEVDRQGLWDDTVVLFWSDHGDYAGQYGLVEKWDTCFSDCLTRVPCFIIAPGFGARRVDSLTETVDLTPTLTELLGLPGLPGVQGESLIPVIDGTRRKEAVFADGGHEAAMRARFPEANPPEDVEQKRGRQGQRLAKTLTYARYPESMARARMVRTDRWKLVVRENGGNELYDLDNDPYEMENLYNVAPDYADGVDLRQVKLDLSIRMNEFALRTDPEEPYLETFTV